MSSLDDRDVRSGYGAILPRPWVDRVEKPVMGFGDVLIFENGQLSKKWHCGEDFLFERYRLKMAYNKKVFFLVKVAQVPRSVIVLEGVEDLKFH
jgi:hypothetical protein